jgi:hypothetical protein
VFHEIYTKNLWGNEESRSGVGSTVAHTENLRRHLPIIIEHFEIRQIIDAPCGDFNWMRHVSLAEGVTYVGADIVPDLIARNRRLYEDRQHGFIVANILTDPLPAADLLICRDCLIHFSYRDIYLALKNFLESDIRLLLTTTHLNSPSFENTNIHTGDVRLLDLFSEPFCFPKEVLYQLEDTPSRHTATLMCLWSRDHVASAVDLLSRHIAPPSA